MKTSRLRSLAVLLGIALLFTACGHLQYAQFPQAYNNEGRKVTATVKHLNFLGLFPAKDTYKVVEQLSKKCKKESDGKVSNITYEVVRKSYFGIALGTEVTATGYCCCSEDGAGSDDEDEEDDKKRKRRRR